MAVITSNVSGSWATGATWVGGVKPADNDSVVIANSHSVLMDDDLSAYTGLQNVTISGHAATPALLYFKDGTSGYLKIRTGYKLLGTTGAVKGRLLANSDGIWRGVKGTTVTCSASTDTFAAVAHGLIDGTLISFIPDSTSTVLPAPVDGAKNYYVRDKTNDTFKIALTSGGVAIDLTTGGTGTFYFNTCLTFANKAIIDLGATSYIDAQYLDISLLCTQPTRKFVRTYKTKYDFTASAGTVDTVNNTIDLGVTPPTAGTIVMITSATGTLPTGLQEDVFYYVRGVSGTKCKLALQNTEIAIVSIAETGSGICTLFAGHTNTATATMNVLDDVTGDVAWVTTAGHNNIGLTNNYNIDQQRMTLTTINAETLVLSANVDSTQYPGSKITLSSRNVSIRSTCTTSINIIDYTNASTSAGVFQCEIRSAAGTGWTYYGTGIYSGTGHIISGTISGCTNGIYSGTGHIISGAILGCMNGMNAGLENIISGTIMGCDTGIYNVTGNIISGSVIGCIVGIQTGTRQVISGILTGCSTGVRDGVNYIISGTISGCSTGVYAGSGNIISGNISGCGTGISRITFSTFSGNVMACSTAILACNVLNISGNIGYNSSGQSIPNGIDFDWGGFIIATLHGRAKIHNPPIFASRVITNQGYYGCKQQIACEDYAQVLGASYTWLMSGDIIKNTSVVRPGGSSSSIEVIPLSHVDVNSPIQIFEWTETNVPTSVQNRSIYVKGEGWTIYPTASELYFEAEYISDATTFATTVIASTEVIDENTNWHLLSISFTPAIAGHVRYHAYLKKYASACKIYVDNRLN